LGRCQSVIGGLVATERAWGKGGEAAESEEILRTTEGLSHRRGATSACPAQDAE